VLEIENWDPPKSKKKRKRKRKENVQQLRANLPIFFINKKIKIQKHKYDS
jgi:hypothetical protein